RADRGLILRLRERPQRRNVACAGAAIVPEAININFVVRRVCLDLEGDRLAHVHADVGRESLDRGIASAADVPTVGGPRQRVLDRNGITARQYRVTPRTMA